MRTTSDESVNVLLIEDNPTDVRLVQELLHDAPNGRFIITSASTLAQGLSHLDSDAIDVVLLDLGLPDSQGFDSFHAISKHTPDVPVVVLTVSTDEDLGQRIVLEGAQQFFSKDVLTPDGAYAEMFPRMIRIAIERKRTEAALRQSKEELQTLFEHSPIAQIRYDAHGTPTVINRAAGEFLGIEDVSLIRHLNIFTSPRVPHVNKEQLKAGKPTRYEQTYDFDAITREGGFLTTRSGVRYADFSLAPIFDAEGTLEAYLAQLVDITERKQAESALQDAHEKVQALNEELRSTNEELRVANEELEHRVQERTEELASMNEELQSTNDKLRNGIGERQRAEEAANAHAHRISTLNSVIKAGNAADDVQTALETMLSAALAMLDFDAGMIYLMNEEGKVEYRCGRGIAVRMVEQGLDAPFSHGATGAVYREEPMQLYVKDGDRHAFQELAAGAVIPLIAKEQAIGHYAVFSHVKHHFSTEEKDLLEVIGREAGTVIARLQAEEELQRYSSRLEELVEARTVQLKDAERLAGIGETAAMIGHDLRNPLQSLQYIVDLQKLRFERMASRKRDTKDWQQEQALFDRISEQIFYMDKIVGDLQDYARPIQLEHETMAVGALINDVLLSLPHTNGVQVSVNAGTIHINADPILIRRACANLILNAMQAMPHGGTLTIGARADNGSVAIHITDTGVGIPVEMRDKLFSPLTTGKAKGTGLGLAVVKRIVEAHNGTITFESEEGKGTTFTVTLPTVAPS